MTKSVEERIAVAAHEGVRTSVLMMATYATAIEGEDLFAWQRAIDRADTVGPIVDPTGWMRRKDELDAMKELAAAFSHFRRAALKLRELKDEQGIKA